jgi:hypothetical protein
LEPLELADDEVGGWRRLHAEALAAEDRVVVQIRARTRENQRLLRDELQVVIFRQRMG